jgi:lipopolysaccharide export system protein LptA
VALPSLALIAGLALAMALIIPAAPQPAQAQSVSGPTGGPMDTTGPISITADRMTADDTKRLVIFTGKVVARQGELVISCDLMRVAYQPAGSYQSPASSAPSPADAPASAAPSPAGAPAHAASSPAGAPPRGDPLSIGSPVSGAPSSVAAPVSGTAISSAADSPGPPPASDLGAAVDRAVGFPEDGKAEGGMPSGPDPEGGQAGGGDRQSPLLGGQEIDRVECEGAVKIQQGERMAVADRALYLAKALPRRLVLTGEARVWQGANSITGHQITYYLDENRSLVDSQGSRRVRAFYEQGGRR